VPSKCMSCRGAVWQHPSSVLDQRTSWQCLAAMTSSAHHSQVVFAGHRYYERPVALLAIRDLEMSTCSCECLLILIHRWQALTLWRHPCWRLKQVSSAHSRRLVQERLLRPGPAIAESDLARRQSRAATSGCWQECHRVEVGPSGAACEASPAFARYFSTSSCWRKAQLHVSPTDRPA
jgi:hypothetical protein